MGRHREAETEAARRTYCQSLKKLTECIATGNVGDIRNICESIFKIIDIVNPGLPLLVQNESDNPLNQSNLIIFACKHEQYKVLEYLFSGGEKLLLKLYEKIGSDFIHPGFADSFKHNALYYAIRSNNVKLVNLLTEKWPGFDFGKNVESFEHALSFSYQELRLRNVEVSLEMEFLVESKLYDCRLALNAKRPTANPGVTMPHILERVDWLISKIHRTLDDASGDQTEILLQNFNTIAQNIHVLKSVLRSTYDVIPWEEMEFCLVTYVRTRVSKDDLNILYWSIITKSALTSHLKNFNKCLEIEKDCLLGKHDVNDVKSFPTIEREQAVKTIIKKYPFFQNLYLDFERSRDVRSLAIMSEYMSTSLAAGTEDKSGRYIVVRTLQVIAQCFQNSFEFPMLTHESRKRLFSNLERNTRKIIIDIRRSLPSSFVLSKRAEKEDGDTVTFFSELLTDIGRLSKVVENMIDTRIFLQIKRNFRTLVDCNEMDTVDEITKSFRSMKSSGLAVSGSITMLQLLIEKLRVNEPLSLHALFVIDNASSFLAKIKRSIVSDEALQSLRNLMQTWVTHAGLDLSSDEHKPETIHSMAQVLVTTFSELEETNLSQNLGFGVIDFLSIITPRLNEAEYYDVYMLVAEIINIIDLLDDNSEFVEEMHSRLRNHNEKFPFDFCFPYRSLGEIENVKNESIAKRIAEIRSIVRVDSCNGKIKNYELQCIEEKGTQLSLELLLVETLYFMGNSQERLKNDHKYVDARVPLLYGTNFFYYLIHKIEIPEICFRNPATCVANNARLIAFGNVVGNKGYLNDKQALNDVDGLTEEDFHVTNVVGFQQKLFHALSDGNMATIDRCLENGADIFGRNCNNTTALHCAAMGPNSEPLKYVLDQWKGKSVARNTDGANPLHVAVLSGREENVKLLLTRGKICIDAPDDFGRTSLHYSVSTAFTKITKLLLTYNANPNAIDQQGHTPLKQALYNKNIESSKIILANEKFCYDDIIGVSPLDVASEKGLTELLPTLMKLDANASHANRNERTSAGMSFTPLHYAATSGHLECVKILLRNGWNVNAKTLNGATPLSCSVMSNKEDVVRFILEKGADAKACDSIILAAHKCSTKITEILLAGKASVNMVHPILGRTPLHSAALYNRKDVVDVLVKNGARLNAKDNHGCTALHYCAQAGNYDLSKVLMKYGAKTNMSDKFGYFPHMYAVLSGSQEIVELTASSTNVNAIDSMGHTALHLSCKEGNVGIVRCLLDKGAKVNVKSDDKRTPLHVAVMNGFHEIVNLLLEKDASINDMDSSGFTALHHAAAFGRAQIMKILIQSGASVNRALACGYTPLHLACEGGSVECTAMLIDKGCSMNTKTQDGNTPLRMSVAGNNKKVVELLVKKNIKIDDDTVQQAVELGFGDVLEVLLNGSPAQVKKPEWLLIAACKPHPDIIKILVKRGADINGRSTFIGARPLHGAVRTGDADAVKLLLELGANPNAKSRAGDIPMHSAAKLGLFEIVHVLLKHKSKILAKDIEGRTSLDFAVSSGHVDIVDLFLKHDKTININSCLSTDQRWPLLHIAAQSGNIDVVKLLVEKGADINRKINTGSKAIHIAAREGFSDVVEFFLRKGMSIYDSGAGGNNLLHYVAHGSGDCLNVAKLLVCNRHMDLNRVNKDGWTPLHFAVNESKDKQLIQFFMKNGAYYDVKDLRGSAAKDIPTSFPIRLIFHSAQQLLSAAKRGDLSQLRNNIRQGVVVDSKNERNETPLLCATWKGNDEIVNELLAKGANPDLAGKSGSTPLHYAAKSSHYTILLALLGSGAVFETYNEGNKTPLEYATNEKISRVLKLIQDTFLKIKVGDTEVLKSLRKMKLRPDEVKALVNCRDRHGKTIVACAMLENFPDVKCLQSVFRDHQHLEKAETSLSSGRFREALSIAKSERIQRQAIFTDDSMMNAAVDFVVAVSLYETQRYNDALRVQQKLYETCKQMLGEDKVLTMNIESLKALICQKKGESGLALKLFEAVNEKQKSILSPLHPGLIKTQINMCSALMSLGKLDRALELSRDLAERCILMYKDDHFVALGVQNNIAKIMAQKGRHDEALEIHKKVFEKQKIVLGPKNRETLQTMIDIGHVYCLQKKFKDAIKVIVDAMKIQSGTLDKFRRECKGDFKSAIFSLLKCGKVIDIFKDHVDHTYVEQESSSLNFIEMIERSRRRRTFSDDNDGYIPSSFPGNPSSVLNHIMQMNILRHLGMIDFGVSSGNEEDVFDHLFNSPITNIFQDIQVDESSDDSIVEEKIDKTTAFQAVATGDVEVVEKMIDSEIDFNATDEEGRTFLHYAISSGSLRLVESLIENGAEVNLKSKKGNTTLHTAALSGRADIAEMILKNVKNAERCTFIDSRTSKNGMTALHIAALKGKFEVVKTLLKNGATFNSTNNDHKTPLDLSVNEDVTSTLKKLDDIFKTVIATTNSVKGLSKDDWINMRVSRNADGGALLTEIVKCKDLLDRMVITQQSSESFDNKE